MPMLLLLLAAIFCTTVSSGQRPWGHSNSAWKSEASEQHTWSFGINLPLTLVGRLVPV